MCGLSLPWVTSENSTMLLESDILRLFFTGPYLISSPLYSVSGVDYPSVDPRQPLCCSPLSCPAATPSAACLSALQPPTLSLLSNYQLPLLGPSHQLSPGSRRQLSFSGPATNSPLSCPTTNCLSLGRVVNSRSRPLTTSGYGESSGPRILCLVSRQNRLVCFGGLPP